MAGLHESRPILVEQWLLDFCVGGVCQFSEYIVVPSMIMGGCHKEASDWHFVLFCQVYEGLPGLLVHVGVVHHHTLARHEALIGQSDCLFFPSSPVIACNNHTLIFKPCSYHRLARSLDANHQGKGWVSSDQSGGRLHQRMARDRWLEGGEFVLGGGGPTQKLLLWSSKCHFQV